MLPSTTSAGTRTTSVEADTVSPASQSDWGDVSDDPDLHQDLDYELLDLDVLDIEVADQVMVLPEETEMLKEDAFIVVEEDDVCDLAEWA